MYTHLPTKSRGPPKPEYKLPCGHATKSNCCRQRDSAKWSTTVRIYAMTPSCNKYPTGLGMLMRRLFSLMHLRRPRLRAAGKFCQGNPVYLLALQHCAVHCAALCVLCRTVPPRGASYDARCKSTVARSCSFCAATMAFTAGSGCPASRRSFACTAIRCSTPSGAPLTCTWSTCAPPGPRSLTACAVSVPR